MNTKIKWVIIVTIIISIVLNIVFFLTLINKQHKFNTEIENISSNITRLEVTYQNIINLDNKVGKVLEDINKITQDLYSKNTEFKEVLQSIAKKFNIILD